MLYQKKLLQNAGEIRNGSSMANVAVKPQILLRLQISSIHERSDGSLNGTEKSYG